MSLPPKAPPIYKPNVQRVAAPRVYRPQQMQKPAVQPKAVRACALDARPAPPVYRPTASATQMKAAPAPVPVRINRPRTASVTPAVGRTQVNTRLVTPAQPGRPIQFKPAPAVNGPFRSAVVQRVTAYRVGTTASKYKIEIEDGKIKSLSGGRSGIDISFGDREHANYYFATKKSDSGAVLDEWDFPDDVYELIVYRMKNPMKQECPDDKKAALWDKIKKLPAPVNSTDQVVTKGGLIAPHFQLEWIPLLEKYSKGKKVTRTTVAEAFPPEPPKVTTGFKNDDVGTVYLPADEFGPEEVEGQMTYEKYLTSYKSGGYGFRV